MDVTLLVLAAGMGSRYGGLKQLERVGPSGETLMDYSVYDAVRAGFARVVFVIRKDMEREFCGAVLDRYAGAVDVAYVFQSPDDLPGGFSAPAGRVKPWGTGQAVYAARKALNGPFAVINADDFYGAESFSKLASHLRNCRQDAPVDCCMCGFTMRNTLSPNGPVSRGICRVDREWNLIGVTEHTKLAESGPGTVVSSLPDGGEELFTGDEIVSMNCWGFAPSLFDGLERLLSEFLRRHGTEPGREFYIPDAVADLIADRSASVRVLPTGGKWLGVTYREDLPRASAEIRRLVSAGVYPDRLFS